MITQQHFFIFFHRIQLRLLPLLLLLLHFLLLLLLLLLLSLLIPLLLQRLGAKKKPSSRRNLPHPPKAGAAENFRQFHVLPESVARNERPPVNF